MSKPITYRISTCLLVTFAAAAIFVLSATYASAATMSLTPGSNVYNSGATFSVQVRVNPEGDSINAAEGTLRFNPSQLSVVNVSRSSSIFNLWVAEPSFSNSDGTISFSGGSPSGYSGGSGNIMTATFQARGSGSARVSFANGSVLANDGRGTNVLSGMNGGTYTIQAANAEPEEEVIVEFVAPANTPAAPNVTSATHPDPDSWFNVANAEVSWSLPADVTAVRTLLSNSPTAIPNVVYDTPIDSLSLELEEGVQYLHVQFRNSDGWGRVSHYRLAVDTEAPTDITIASPDPADFTNPEQSLVVDVADSVSEVNDFKIRIDANEPFEYTRENASSTILLPVLDPGYHTVVVEAFDQAGNSIVGTYSLTIEAFARPEFTNVPTQINEGVVPVISGVTRPNSSVNISLTQGSSEPLTYTTQSDGEGVFTFIPEGPLSAGVYDLTARATDERGAQSELSEPVRLAVQQPGYVRIGGFIVSFLSVIIPLLALIILFGLTLWYGVIYLRRFRKRVQVESFEALEIVKKEFAALHKDLSDQAEELRTSRKTKKLTKAEDSMFNFMSTALNDAEAHIEKEVDDVAKAAKSNNTKNYE